MLYIFRYLLSKWSLFLSQFDALLFGSYFSFFSTYLTILIFSFILCFTGNNNNYIFIEHEWYFDTLWKDKTRVIIISVTSNVYHFFLVSTFKILYFSYFEIHNNALLLAVVIELCNGTLDIIPPTYMQLWNDWSTFSLLFPPQPLLW
jgi:hypothetical protein